MRTFSLLCIQIRSFKNFLFLFYRITARTFHLQVAAGIIESYIFLGGTTFLNMHASSVAELIDVVVGNVNNRGLLSFLPIVEFLVQVFSSLFSNLYFEQKKFCLLVAIIDLLGASDKFIVNTSMACLSLGPLIVLRCYSSMIWNQLLPPWSHAYEYICLEVCAPPLLFSFLPFFFPFPFSVTSFLFFLFLLLSLPFSISNNSGLGSLRTRQQGLVNQHSRLSWVALSYVVYKGRPGAWLRTRSGEVWIFGWFDSHLSVRLLVVSSACQL